MKFSLPLALLPLPIDTFAVENVSTGDVAGSTQKTEQGLDQSKAVTETEPKQLTRTTSESKTEMYPSRMGGCVAVAAVISQLRVRIAAMHAAGYTIYKDCECVLILNPPHLKHKIVTLPRVPV
jgi:hypothetical protein